MNIALGIDERRSRLALQIRKSGCLKTKTRRSRGKQLTQVLVSIWSSAFRIPEGGALSRGQNQISMLVIERSIAKTPPPFSLKAGPKESALGSETPQPVLPFMRALQSVDRVLPVWFRFVGMVHPGDVWRVMVFVPTSFTPSRMSTSPP